MYCKNCNAFNDDGNRFCANCGAPLSEQAPQYAEQPQTGSCPPPRPPYQQPYQQPYYGAQPPMEPTKPLTSALPIAALILSIVFANVIGIVLGAFALVNFNRYNDALRAGDIGSAETFKAKSRRLSSAAIVLTVVLFVLVVIAAIVGGVFFGFRVLESGGLESPLVEFNYGNGFTTMPDIPAVIGSLF